MGGAKRMLEEHDHKKGIAIGIAVDSGALSRCEMHTEFYEGDGDFDEAFEHGKKQFKSKGYDKVFDSLDDMRSIIKEVVEESADECWRCAKMAAE